MNDRIKKKQETLNRTMLAAAFVAAVTGAVTLYLTVEQGAAPAPKSPPENTAPPDAFRDRAAPEACAMLADFRDVAKKIPAVQLDLAVLSNLPLTGKPVFETDTAPENAVKACLFPVLPGTSGGSEYLNEVIRQGRPNGAITFGHESFHAYQEIRLGGYSRIEKSLTARDAIAAEFLKEATAVAYERTIAKEAYLAGVSLPPHSPDLFFASDKAATQAVFNKAYDNMQASLTAQSPGLDSTDREAKSLEAGGQAVVRALLSDTDTGWQSFYQKQAIRNVNAYRGGLLLEDGRETRSDYAATRADIYARLGYISDAINLTPPEFLGPGAEPAIARSLQALGVQIDPSQTPVAAATPAPGARRPA